MKSYISGRVFKGCDVEVSTPRMVECIEGFQQLGAVLAVLSVEEVSRNSVNPAALEQPAELPSPIETEARTQAARIIAEAEERAGKIFEEGKSDFERLRQEVVEMARTEIYPAAQAEGYQVGLEAGEAEGKRLSDQANQLFQLAQHAVQEEYFKVEEDLLLLAIKIAERIVRSSLAVEPQRIVAIIQALTLLPQERVGWRLHVAPDDSRLLEGDQSPCPWVIDESLKPGDCFLECQEGLFDARLEAQLDKLGHTLREELKHGSVESIDADGRAN